MNAFPHFQEAHPGAFRQSHLGMPNGHLQNGIPHHEMLHPQSGQAQLQQNGFINGISTHQPHSTNGHVPQQIQFSPDINVGMSNLNGMPPQGPFPPLNNAMMAAMNMNMNMNTFNPFLHMVQESARLSVPVGTYPDDQHLLVETLHQTASNGLTYRQAIETLHERNNHSAMLWKDYYLDHKNEIDALVSTKSNPTVVRGAKKPSLKDFRPLSSPERQPPPTARPKVKPRHSKSGAAVKTEPIETTRMPEPPTRRRQTINSLTAPVAVFNSKLPAPAADVQIPAPPSRSPTPPTKVIPTTRGNKYTPEDRDYFIKFLTWRLKQDPHLTKNQICEELAEKVPHHTAASWGSHWGIRHELADKILAHAKQSIEDEDEDESSDEDDDDSDYERRKPSSSSGPLRQPNYKESSSESNELSFNEVDNDLTDADAHGSDDVEAPRPKRVQVSTKAQPLSFGNDDLRMMARHIANLPNFDALPSGERWKPFTDKHPQRSHKAWVEQYRRRKDELDKMAQQIRRKHAAENNRPVKQEERSSLSLNTPPASCPPLPRLGVLLSSYVPPSKRKFDEAGGGPDRIKRSKDIYAD